MVRATSSIAQALAAGYERVLCCREIDEANALRRELGDEAVVGGERNGVVVEGFDVGASPREFAEGPRAPTLILSTTNGTATILAAAARCETVLVGSLLNLDAVVRGGARGRRRRRRSSAPGSRARSRSTTRSAPAGSSTSSAASGPTRRSRPSGSRARTRRRSRA